MSHEGNRRGVHRGKDIHERLVAAGITLRDPPRPSRSKGLHLRLEALVQGLELVHVSCLRRPADAKALLLIGLGDLAWVLAEAAMDRLFSSVNVPCGSEPVGAVLMLARNPSCQEWAWRTYVVDNLVGDPAVVLEDIEVRCLGCDS